MLVDTAYMGSRRAGDIIEVPDDFAFRWTKNRIAEYVIEKSTEDKEEETGAPEGFLDESETLEKMTSKELYGLCIERAIEVEPKMPKAHYIELLTK
jgi:hypothetical protein